ncbi:hypothetical protein [Sporomusa malonica]|uniref:Uncharacterized protein n=2 Tax=Sporomusa malonica TaxID=112901 RepID=A0A1W2CSQ0_9FIRM|nr:hypothetical protein SAMN04488500_111124 [Sporomusa malonica]
MNRKIKYIGIVIFSVVLCSLLHVITPPALTSETPQNTLSALALLLGFPLTALLWMGIAYSCVAFVFYLIEDRIPGEKGARGFRYGISIGVLWLLGYVMCAPKFGNPFINEFVGGLCDAIPVVVMGWVLGLFTTKKDLTDTLNTFNKNQPFIGIVIFVLVFSIARIVSYYMNIIDTGFQVNTDYTLVWTIVMGFWLGIIYMLLGKTMTSSSALVSAVKFGFLLFGLTWGIFIMFFPLMLKGQLINTILMFLIDTLSVTAAYYFSEILLNRSPGVNHKCQTGMCK